LSKCQVKAVATLPSSIDTKVIAEFKAMMGENAETILVEIIDCYLENAHQHIETIARAISQNDTAELRRVSHTLKSSSATLGATKLATLCQELETLSRSLGNIGDSSSHTEDGAEQLAQIQAE
jgi:HPt (histidine-containing phosphotransfer) domain-containing protein